MENYNVEKGKAKQSNGCASIGFLLTLLNLVVSFALGITENTLTLFIFSGITAVISLVLCIFGDVNSRRAGKGKVISIIGIIFNALILTALIVVATFLLLFIQACSNIQLTL